jgi:iron(III) transport system permease protein
MIARLRQAGGLWIVSTVISAVIVLGIVAVLVGLVQHVVSDAQSFGTAFHQIAHSPATKSLLRNTVVVVGVSAVVSVAIAAVLAWLNERTDARLGVIAGVMPVVPMLLPSIAGAIGWTLLCSPRAGFINVYLQQLGHHLGVHVPVLDVFTMPGLIFVYSIYMVPQAYLPIAAAFASLDPSLEEASRVSGKGPWRTLARISVPAVWPAILSGLLLTLVYGLSVFSIPLIIGTQAHIDVLPVQIIRLLTASYPPQLSQALILAAIIFVVLAIVWWINARVVSRGNFATISGKSSGERRLELGAPVRYTARLVMVVYLLIASVLPMLALLAVSFQAFWSGRLGHYRLDNYRAAFRSGSEIASALKNSLVLGAVAATVGMVLAVIISWRVARGGVFGRVVDGITKLPTSLSHIVIAVALLAVVAGPPLKLSGTFAILLIAYLVIYLPQGLVNAQASYARVGGELIEASLVCGEGNAGTLRRVSAPLMLRGLTSGWAFVFVAVIGDITATTILASTHTPAVGFVILEIFNNGTFPQLATLAVVITGISAVVVLSVLALGTRERTRRRGVIGLRGHRPGQAGPATPASPPAGPVAA